MPHVRAGLTAVIGLSEEGHGVVKGPRTGTVVLLGGNYLPVVAEEREYWRSDAEKAHVYARFDEARATYQGLLAEARALGRE